MSRKPAPLVEPASRRICLLHEEHDAGGASCRPPSPRRPESDRARPRGRALPDRPTSRSAAPRRHSRARTLRRRRATSHRPRRRRASSPAPAAASTTHLRHVWSGSRTMSSYRVAKKSASSRSMRRRVARQRRHSSGRIGRIAIVLTRVRLTIPRRALRRRSLAASDLEVAARALQRRVPPFHRGPAAPAGLGAVDGLLQRTLVRSRQCRTIRVLRTRAVPRGVRSDRRLHGERAPGRAPARRVRSCRAPPHSTSVMAGRPFKATTRFELVYEALQASA